MASHLRGQPASQLAFGELATQSVSLLSVCVVFALMSGKYSMDELLIGSFVSCLQAQITQPMDGCFFTAIANSPTNSQLYYVILIIIVIIIIEHTHTANNNNKAKCESSTVCIFYMR